MLGRCFLVCVVLFLANPGLADLRSCQALHANGPTVLGGFELVSSGSLEKLRKGAGFIRVYHGPDGSKASVNYYAGGHRSITDQVFRQEFVEQACNMLEYAYDHAHTFDNLNVIRPQSKTGVFQAMAQGKESSGSIQKLEPNADCVLPISAARSGDACSNDVRFR